LSAAGYQVSPAGGAHEALALHQTSREPFACVVAEVRLAHLNGFELARRLQDRDPAGSFVFVQMQSYPIPSRDDRLRQFELLCRPFEPPALLEAVRAALGRRRGGEPAKTGTVS